MAVFSFVRPQALEELLELKSKQGSAARILDGGSNVLVYLKEGSIAGGTLVDVKSLEAIKGISVEEGMVEIGAGELIADIIESPVIAERVPFLQEVLRRFANPLVRNMATLAGNIADSSPIGDTIPPLLVLGAEVELAETGGRRTVSLEQFFTGPGDNVLRPEEVILAIRFPIPERGNGGHVKLGLRRGTSCSVASAAVWVIPEEKDGRRVGGIRIALGGVAPTPMRALRTEAAFVGRALEWEAIDRASAVVREEISPITDVRATAEYRTEVTPALVAKAVRQAAGLEE